MLQGVLQGKLNPSEFNWRLSLIVETNKVEGRAGPGRAGLGEGAAVYRRMLILRASTTPPLLDCR